MKKEAITFSDFAKLDICVGKILDIKNLEGSNKILVLTVDLGEDYETVEILAGIAKHINDFSEIIGKKYLFLANLEPKKIAEKFSNGMMLAGDGENDSVCLIEVNNLQIGAKIR